MNYLRRLEPTPSALRNGRVVLVLITAVLGAGVAIIVLVPGINDPWLFAILAATSVTVAGHAVAYIGRPTLLRYRIGLIVATVGIVGAFALMLIAPPVT